MTRIEALRIVVRAHRTLGWSTPEISEHVSALFGPEDHEGRDLLAQVLAGEGA